MKKAKEAAFRQTQRGQGDTSALPNSQCNVSLAKQIADRTQDAYCYDRYRSFKVCAKAILDLGYTERETEAILRSKWMRWAADVQGGKYGQVPAKAIVDALKSPALIFGKREALNFRAKLDAIVAQTFGEEA